MCVNFNIKSESMSKTNQSFMLNTKKMRAKDIVDIAIVEKNRLNIIM